MDKRRILIVGRLFFALLVLTALVSQLVVHIRHGFDVVNFFSYFTNLSNIFASIVFLIGAISLLRQREPTVTDDLVRGAAAAAMVVVGIVYGLLLRNEDLGTLQPWVNTVLHFIMPLAVVADWIYQPPKSRLTIQQVWFWLIYPLVYLVYTLDRGAVVGFYPYPFLNPAKAGGIGAVVLYCIAIFAVFLLVSWGLIALGNTLARPASPKAT
jgi:hypothetical protein